MITEFQFSDNTFGWRMPAIKMLPGINLFVGPSGVGKTRILEHLMWVTWAADSRGNAANFGGCSWRIAVSLGKLQYVWEVNTPAGSKVPHVMFGSYSPLQMVVKNELIELDGRIVYKRQGDDIQIDGEKQIATAFSGSAVNLYQNHPEIEPLQRYLSQAWNSTTNSGFVWLPVFHPPGTLAKALDLEPPPIGSRFSDLWLNAYQLARSAPKRFEIAVVEPFRDAFPTVERVTVDSAAELDPNSFRLGTQEAAAMGIKEKGVLGWVVGQRISSGMRKLLALLLEVELAAQGSLLFIDEVENGYGVNALPAVAEALQRRSDLQIIANSHHPYIIKGIPRSQWRLVHRKGSEISVQEVENLAGMKGELRLDGYTRLLNLADYEGAVE
jgi:AAA domain, putative AbiEii toxin, Type IV TA system